MTNPRPKRFMRYAIFACLLLLIAAGVSLYSTRNAVPELFEELPSAEAPATFPEAQFAKRFRWVKLNSEAFDRAFEVGGKLKLNFFVDAQYLTTIVGKQIHDKSTSTAAALLDDDPETMAIFSRSGDSLYAVFTLSDMRQVVVSHVGGRAYSITEIDPARVGQCMQPSPTKKKAPPKVSLRTDGDKAIEAVNPRPSLEEIQRRLTPDQQMLLTRILSSPEAAAKLGRAFEAPTKPAERPPTDVTVSVNPIAANLLMRTHPETAGTEIATPFLAQARRGYSLYGRSGQVSKMDPSTASQVLYPRTPATEYIDVLFLYTAAAQTTAGSRANVLTRVNALVTQLNSIFARSRISMEIRAVNDQGAFNTGRYIARSRYWENSGAATLPEDYNTPVNSAPITVTVTGVDPNYVSRSSMDNLAFNNRTTHIPEGIGIIGINNGTYTGSMLKPAWSEIVSYGQNATGTAQTRPLGSGSPYARNDVRGLGENAPEDWMARYVPKVTNFDSGGNFNNALDWLVMVPPTDGVTANSWGDGSPRSNSLIYGDQYWGLQNPWMNHIHENPYNDIFGLASTFYSANGMANGGAISPIAGYTWALVPNTDQQNPGNPPPPAAAGITLLNPGSGTTIIDPITNASVDIWLPRLYRPNLVFASNPAGPVAEVQWEFVAGVPPAPDQTNILDNANFLIGPAERTPSPTFPFNILGGNYSNPTSQGVDRFDVNGGHHPYAVVYGWFRDTMVSDADVEYYNSDIFVGPTFDTRFYKQNVRGIATSYYPSQVQIFGGVFFPPAFDTWGQIGFLRAPLRRNTGGQLNQGNWGADAYPYAGFTEVGRNDGVWGERIGGNTDNATYTRAFITGFNYTATPNNIIVSSIVAHGYVAGQQIFVANASNSTLNGFRTLLTVSPNGFTLANSGVTTPPTGTLNVGNTWLTITTTVDTTATVSPSPALQVGDVVRICRATDTTIGGGTGRLYQVAKINNSTSFDVINPDPSSNATGTINNAVDAAPVLHGTTAFSTSTLILATAANAVAADSPGDSGVFRQRFLDNPATLGQYSGAVGLRMDTLGATNAHTAARYPRLHTESQVDEKADVIVLLDTSTAANNFAGLTFQFERRYRTYNAVTNQNYIARHPLHQYPSDGIAQNNATSCAVMWGDNRFAAVVDIVQASLNYTFAHEMGHILGCSHGFADAGLMPDDDSVVFATAFTAAPASRPISPDTFTSMGVHVIGSDGKYYHTIMAFPRVGTSLRLPYFSSPRLFFRDRELNRSTDSLTSSSSSANNCDNAQCISIVGSIVSRYRGATGTGRPLSGLIAGSIPSSGMFPRTNQPLPDIARSGVAVVPLPSVRSFNGVTSDKGVGSAGSGATTPTPVNLATKPAATSVPAVQGATTIKPSTGAGPTTGASIPAASRPPNDNLGKAFVVQGAGQTVRGENKGATREQWESSYSQAFQGKSVWWSWDAPADGRVTFKTEGSNFDTVLLVFVYANGKFLPAALNDNAGNGISWSQITVSARKGARYYLGVDGAGGAEGLVVLNVEQAAAPAPTSPVKRAPGTSATRQKARNDLTPTGDNPAQ